MSARPSVDADATRDAPRVVDSAPLFSGRREIVIRHGGNEYRLRVTRADKLILTK